MIYGGPRWRVGVYHGTVVVDLAVLDNDATVAMVLASFGVAVVTLGFIEGFLARPLGVTRGMLVDHP